MIPDFVVGSSCFDGVNVTDDDDQVKEKLEQEAVNLTLIDKDRSQGLTL